MWKQKASHKWKGRKRDVQYRVTFTHNLTHQLLFYFFCFALLCFAFSPFGCIRHFIVEHLKKKMKFSIIFFWVAAVKWAFECVCDTLYYNIYEYECIYISLFLCLWLSVRLSVSLCICMDVCIYYSVRMCVRIHGESSTFWLLPLTTLAMTRC